MTRDGDIPTIFNPRRNRTPSVLVTDEGVANGLFTHTDSVSSQQEAVATATEQNPTTSQPGGIRSQLKSCSSSLCSKNARKQLDVKSAFLNGSLSSPVYMEQPQGLEGRNPNVVCKLNKALYGLKQAPKCWYSLFNKTIINLGFTQSKKDPCLYFTNTTLLLIYVDDLIMFSKCVNELEFVKSSLSRIFKMTEFKNENLVFLGLEIRKINDSVFISQNELIKKVLQKFKMEDCKPAEIPMQPKLQLKGGKNECNPKIAYKELIGCLMYIMLGSRPDLSFCVSYFSQFQNCFTYEHWTYLKQVLRYLKLTENLGLKFTKNNNSVIQLNAYVDSDFANNIQDRKSISGYVIKINNNAVCWQTKKQNVVALSSAESEYIALSYCVCESLFVGQIISDLLNCTVFPIQFYEDNQSCMRIASTLESKRSKLIDVRHHFVRDCVNSGKIILNYIPTEFQEADIFTKSLPCVKFKYFRDCLNIIDCSNYRIKGKCRKTNSVMCVA
ncbi:uncharacterized protein LOC116181661 isoform X3 [Photinus pyralis]|nr:uncharacterized protein LOC116181661 isoform X3 [Photinus pyralis]